MVEHKKWKLKVKVKNGKKWVNIIIKIGTIFYVLMLKKVGKYKNSLSQNF